MMKMHPRVIPVQSASATFGMNWARSLERLSLRTYADGYLVWNQIDRFWIDSSRQQLSPAEVCAAWTNTDFSTFDHAQAVQEIGSMLVGLVQEHDLTYGEISSVLLDVRTTDAKYHIRVERHPEDPDKPGSMA